MAVGPNATVLALPQPRRPTSSFPSPFRSATASHVGSIQHSDQDTVPLPPDTEMQDVAMKPNRPGHSISQLGLSRSQSHLHARGSTLGEGRGSGKEGVEIGGEPGVLGKKKAKGKQWAAETEDYMEVDALENDETMPRQGR